MTMYNGKIRRTEYCNDCGDSITIGAGAWDSDGVYVESVDGYICNNCLDNYVYCYYCDELYHIDDTEYIDGDYYCNNHLPRYDYSILNGYRNSPPIEFYGTHTDGRYYGVELECDGGDHLDDLLYDLNNELIGERAFFQDDGSLDDGFELITQPMTLDYHMKEFPWCNINQMILDYEYRSHDTTTCGLHIHVSKKAFGNNKNTIDLNIAKLVIIFERFWDKIVTFSRRDYDKIRQWAKKPDYRFYKEDTTDEIIDKSKFSYTDRYSCINLRNDDTVEFRVFRGTLKYNTLIASLQFIDVLMNYVMEATLEDVFEDSFLTMLSDNKYQELTTYLNERGMI